MQRLEVSGAVRPIYGSLGAKGLMFTKTTVRTANPAKSLPLSPTLDPKCRHFESYIKPYIMTSLQTVQWLSDAVSYLQE